MMKYIFNSPFPTVTLLLSFFFHIRLVIAALPTPQYLPESPLISPVLPPDTTQIEVTIPHLDFLVQYVCPTQNDVNKRQEIETITIDKSQIREILSQIRVLELHFLNLMDDIIGGNPDSETNKEINPTVQAELTSTATRTVKKTTAIVNLVTVTANLVYSSKTSKYIASAATTKVTSIKATKSLISLISKSSNIPVASSLTKPRPAAISITSNSNYIFNAKSNSNIAIYYGQSPLTSSSSLSAQCTDPNIDIVILAFVTSQTDSTGKSHYPTVNFGAACNFAQTNLMASQAPGLLYCPDLAREIEICQGMGKKVLLSIGGSTGQIIFGSKEEAVGFAGVLWRLFGPLGVKVEEDLRPFGKTVLDGFDIDNEDNHPEYYDIFAQTFRRLFSTASNRTYYLSSAPQCPFPDASNPTPMLLLCDFVFVQFYNNPGCEIGSSGYEASIKQWASALEGGGENLRWYLGAPAWSAAGPTAYSNIGGAKGMTTVASHIASEKYETFGGVMFWAGPEGLANVKGGKNIIAWAKEGLKR